ncbi:MAG: Rieske 2Fe-2S domain-containing protein [Alphaproteobacteria bacterium]|nr:Rieske 2Fe-2S domain-containing protein [Alphaproteobacteria bacterium]
MSNNALSTPLSNVSLDAVLRDLSSVAAQPFESANPIPGAANHSLAFLQHERQAVFANEWVCVGRGDELAETGDYLVHDIADVPVLIVRQADGTISAFVNACAHRFACLVGNASGNAKRFTCRYHAWTYDLKGDLVRAPYMEMKPDFDPAQHGLRRLRCEVWEGFVYVTLAEQPATSLASVLEPLRENIVGRFDMARYKTVLRETMVWDANWKNLMENFIESYHVPIAHLKTFAKHNKPLEDYHCGEDSDYYCYHIAAQPEETGPGAAHPGNARLKDEWRRMMVDFCVFPCHLITLMPDYLWYITVQPAGIGQMHATWGVAIPPENLADIAEEEYDGWLAGFKDYMDIANDEDKVLVEALYKGSASPLLPAGTYHPIERNLWQFVRYLNRVCGASA